MFNHPDNLNRFHRDEVGAAYTLSYVMVVPMYALLVCVIIESALFFTAKLGTVYAAYAAARTASVWSSATSWDKAQARAESAAVKTMVPFASGTQSLSLPSAASVDAIKYLGAYKKYAKSPVNEKYLLAKYGYAKQSVKVNLGGSPASWDADIKARVTYEFPCNIPGVGRLFGRRNALGRFVVPIVTEVTLANEGPQNDRKTLGIGYGTVLE
jgi:hypothetical protein